MSYMTANLLPGNRFDGGCPILMADRRSQLVFASPLFARLSNCFDNVRHYKVAPATENTDDTATLCQRKENSENWFLFLPLFLLAQEEFSVAPE
jgi:hypothetical protein